MDELLLVLVLLQRGGAPEVFWPLRIPYAPVTTLLVRAAVFAGTRSGGVHDIRDYDQGLPGAAVTAARLGVRAEIGETAVTA